MNGSRSNSIIQNPTYLDIFRVLLAIVNVSLSSLPNPTTAEADDSNATEKRHRFAQKLGKWVGVGGCWRLEGADASSVADGDNKDDAARLTANAFARLTPDI